MKKVNWDEIKEAGTSIGPIPGGYVAKIVNVQDYEDKEHLRIEWDYAYGEFEGYNAECYRQHRFWPTVLYRSYKPKALGFFKQFKTCLEESNPRYTFDEEYLDGLIGKFFGVVLGEEEYPKNNGTKGRRLYVAQCRSVRAIEDGDFVIPPTKLISGGTRGVSVAPPSFTDLDDDDGELPF